MFFFCKNLLFFPGLFLVTQFFGDLFYLVRKSTLDYMV